MSEETSTNPEQAQQAEKKKFKLLSKKSRIGNSEVTLYSIDGATWSSRKDELENIHTRHEQERQSFGGELRGQVSSMKYSKAQRKPGPKPAGAPAEGGAPEGEGEAAAARPVRDIEITDIAPEEDDLGMDLGLEDAGPEAGDDIDEPETVVASADDGIDDDEDHGEAPRLKVAAKRRPSEDEDPDSEEENETPRSSAKKPVKELVKAKPGKPVKAVSEPAPAPVAKSLGKEKKPLKVAPSAAASPGKKIPEAKGKSAPVKSAKPVAKASSAKAASATKSKVAPAKSIPKKAGGSSKAKSARRAA